MPTPRERVTIIDVAREAGVAISSASTALNGQPGVSESTRDRVRSVASALGYVPSARGRALSAKRAYSVGLVVERDFDILESDPFFGAFIGGIEEYIAPRGYVLALQITQDSTLTVDRHLALARSRRVDGVFLNEIKADDARVAELAELGFPAVGINPAVGDFPFPAVRQSGTEAIHELVRTLAELDHRRIAHVSGPPHYVHSLERISAWREAMEAVGLQAEDTVNGGFTSDGGRRAADVLMTGERRPTAVFCANDLSAIGFMNRAIELGFRVPEDVSVAGFDGINFGEHVRPTLSTVRTAPRHLGREAARLLLSAIDGDEAADSTIAPARLVLRDSVARLR
ncbi:LacI family transcriptional regulator [Glaciibacter flavus]|uniref:LacI family transcriptional regulator n=1 Tax=Orlajensenia flava TaxID=2565934 RepID=A0A4S4FRZ5_9MICO|nr:LacI family DNA-binding transcriptional regulator [Glaciibacter flavus]THG32662.1 LacI family transcriptional regulator [Glaciibacter flavus]